jgi:hypothetical protein
MVLIVRWLKIYGFGVSWPNSNSGDSSMVKNGLLPTFGVPARVLVVENEL